MGNNNPKPIRISEPGYEFLYDIVTNVRMIMKSKNMKRVDLSMPEALELIAKYFKNNNDRYLELIKLHTKENEQ